MKNQQLLTVLEDLGLSQNEALVYLTSLSLGPSTILGISKAAQIRRTTVYPIIESLKKKGLMHIEPNGFKQLFAAEHPEKLESVLETKKHSLKRLFPEFLSLYNLKGGESTIRYYEGLESVKTIYDTVLDSMKPKDDYMVISDTETFFNMDPEYFENFLKKRSSANIRARLLVTNSSRAQHMKQYAKNMNHEIKILPENTHLAVDVMITPQQVVIFNLEQPVSAVQIINNTTIKFQQQMFEIVWNSIAP